MTSIESIDHISEEVFVFPASFAQQRLWFLNRLFSGTSFYNVPTTVRLAGVLDLKALEESFNEIVRRHEILRTNFGVQEGQPVQLITPHSKVFLKIFDLQQLPASEREAAAQQAIAREIQQPFNLDRDSLLRVTLLQLDELEYVLVINLHHIVFDEWSIAILIRELELLYSAFSMGKPSPLPELSIQYADFAHWQRQWLQGEVLESQLSYWRSQLQNLSVLEVESNRCRPKERGDRGAIKLLELPQDLSQALLTLSHQEGVTLFMTLLAAFQVLLYRYTGQTDIAVGSPIANRNRRELEDLIGFFANSLVLRTDVSGNPSFRELLARVRQVTVEAYAHQDLPFEKLVEELHPERQGSRNPLFQVVFALQNAPIEQLTLPKLSLSSFKVETTTARFDLEFYLWECAENFRSLWGDGWQQAEGLRGVLVYNTELFKPSAIARMLTHFQTLLTGVVTDPDTNLADLPILSAAEQHQLVEWNQTRRSYPERCIYQLFELQVEQSPNAIAVSFGDRQYTYHELNSGSNQLAHYLRKLGVGCKTLVGICMEPSPMAIASLLGILKAGAAYVPLDPTYPPERLQFMLEDAQVSVLVTQQALAPLFRLSWGDRNLKVVCLEKDWEAIAQESEQNLSDQTTVDNLAYVIYTSGSTGTPKGVAVTHRAVNRLVCNTNYITLEPGDKVAQCANLSFDAATFEIWGALLNGAQLVGCDREVMLSPQKFAQEIRQQEISILFLTTALFNQMAREVPDCFRSLRYLLFGGEAVDLRWVKAVKQHGAPAHLLHVYGPTENTTFTSWYEVQDVPEAATSIPIGRPVASTQIYLLDAHLNPVPIGVTGEIYLGGDGLAKEYLNRPQLTEQRFICQGSREQGRAGSWELGEEGAEDAEGTGEAGEEKTQPPITNYQLPITDRLYKTGDLARYLPDGNLEFVGRTDSQIKLRGFRIELGEIETVLKQYPSVEETVVVVREDGSSDRHLVAYIVLNTKSPQPPFLRGASQLLASQGGLGGIGASEFPPSQGGLGGIGDLRSFLKTKLPNYMMPSAFVVVKALPLTPNGKVDRQALPSPDFTSIDLPTLAPRTSVEAQLAQLWAETLGRQVGISDDFFELGGHSLLATQLVSRIRDRLGVEVPLGVLFETPTIVAIAQYIDAIRGADLVQTAEAETSAQNREEVEF
ncbi:MAG: Linear gramicidin synthase subunit B [Chroococcidiopsis sp. SAG 2025]|uniref:non-ribosomal peptide synthetase n=1 Tax=Chroococcidiopsis sp. SAG 2025 TaxID=171389 RepID=UPI002936FECC|nr:amino acid adenylation domain-containing protein [Chroococcidiopsis sp. SAG 2025]MDV2992592.1 Linear gramicidin synthase subunit B [Chroococcidiopsis sp. SAG 2025]